MKQVVLYSPSLGTLDLTATAGTSGRAFSLWLANYDMGLLQPDLSAIEGMFGDTQDQTGYADRTPTFHVASGAATEANRVAGGETLEQWITAGDCELRYVPDDGPTSCLLILSGYVAHVASPSNSGDKFAAEWQGNQIRWYEVHPTTAPQVLAADATTTPLTGAGIATGDLDIDGTFPAAATITATAASGLGKTIIHTSPVHYTPSIRSHLQVSSSETLSRAGAPHFYKGASSDQWPQLTGCIFGVPAGSIAPGDYAFVAHVYNNSDIAQTLLPAMTVTTVIGGNIVDTAPVGSIGVTVPAQSFALISLGAAAIDRAGISAGAESSTTINVATGDFPASIWLDDLFAFRIDPMSSLTMVDAGSGSPALGTAHSLVSLAASPRPDQVPTISRGLASDATQAMGPGADLAQMESPMLAPGYNMVFVASAGVDGTVTAEVAYRSAHATYVDAA